MMGFESTMICVDSSDYMRNGDFLPTRLQAQQDAVYLICRAKARAHPENDVGLMTLANIKVLVTLTTDIGRILIELNKLSPGGNIDFLSGLQIAQLALRHRQEKSHKMRIVAFVGSPIDVSDQELVALAKKLKKEKVNVDVVSFGEEAETANGELLTSFIDTLNGKQGGSSRLLTVTAGPSLNGALVSSPIVLGEDGSLVLPGEVYGADFQAEEDPELALALQMSLAEHRKLDAAQAGEAQGQTSDYSSKELKFTPDENPSNMTEEEQIAYAIQLSMMNNKEVQPKEQLQQPFSYEDILEDAEFLRALLDELEHIEEDSDDQADGENNKRNNS